MIGVLVAVIVVIFIVVIILTPRPLPGCDVGDHLRDLAWDTIEAGYEVSVATIAF